MVEVGLDIVAVHQDPQVAKRLQSGQYRTTQELNQEWVDLQNNGPYVLNLQARVLACMKRDGLRSAPRSFECLRQAQIRSSSTIPLQPGQKLRIYSGEQPRTSTYIADAEGISRVIWLVQSTYLWLPEGNEVHLYNSLADLQQAKKPLSRHILF